MRATVPVIESEFLSLDFIYVPTRDIDTTVRHYVEVLGAELRWKVRGMSSRSPKGPAPASGPPPASAPAATHFDGTVDEP